MSSLSSSCSQGTFTQFFATVGWACDSTVQFYTSNSTLAPSVALAVEAWRSSLQATGKLGLPIFTTTDIVNFAEATVIGTGTGYPFCGDWNNGTRQLRVLSGSACDSFDNKDGLSNLLLHEVGHAVGWTGTLTDKVVFATSEADHCVMNLPTDGSINSSICAHEIEGALAAYGLATYHEGSFFSTPFVVGSANGLGPVTLPVGDSIVLLPGEWRLDRGGFVAGSGSSYTWSAFGDGVVEVLGGQVKAIKPGTAIVRATPASNPGYLFAHPFAVSGVASTITVPPPAPQILLDEVPVWTEGYHTFTYVGPGTPGPLTWWIDDSRTTTINPDLIFTTPGWTATVYITAGSYTLRVTLGEGTLIQDFPVCTGASEPNLNGGKGTAGTDAVENCPPPESQE